jgi:hypothetical protein
MGNYTTKIKVKKEHIINHIHKTNSFYYIYDTLLNYPMSNTVLMMDIDETFLQYYGSIDIINEHKKYVQELLLYYMLTPTNHLYFITNRESHRDSIHAYYNDYYTDKDINNYIPLKKLNIPYTIIFKDTFKKDNFQKDDLKYNNIKTLILQENIVGKTIVFIDDIDRHVKHFADIMEQLNMNYIGFIIDFTNINKNTNTNYIYTLYPNGILYKKHFGNMKNVNEIEQENEQFTQIFLHKYYK